jgi:hypothetical protein
MNSMVKAALAAVATVYISDMLVGTLTSAEDSATERLLWRLGSAAAVGIAVSKIL